MLLGRWLLAESALVVVIAPDLPSFAVEALVDEKSEVCGSVLPAMEDIFMFSFCYYLRTNSFQLHRIQSVANYFH
jgi:hypothetical protein